MVDRISWIHENVFGKIIDIGCHDGHVFAGTNFQVVGVDLDKWKVPNPPYIDFKQADAADLPFEDNTFDVAVVAEILEHVPDPVKALSEARRVARLVVFTTPNEYNWAPEYRPLMSLEERLKLDHLSFDELWKKETKDNPACIEPTNEKENPHLWHVRHYDTDMIISHLEQARLKYRINLLQYSGWSFFVGKAW